MAYNKIKICNMALAFLGEDSIRSFDENNTRASLCDRMYDPMRDYQLTRFDWNFARKLTKLNPLEQETPPGTYAYGLPADCRAVRELYPLGSKEWWEVLGRVFLCKRAQEVYIYYTANSISEALFPDTFAFILSLSLAIKIAPALTQDKALTRSLFEQYKMEESEVWEADANISNQYKPVDGMPEYDTFVYPDNTLLVDQTVPENR